MGGGPPIIGCRIIGGGYCTCFIIGAGSDALKGYCYFMIGALSNEGMIYGEGSEGLIISTGASIYLGEGLNCVGAD